ncbi:MAG: guanylate kinase [Candidatus Binatia bacterium]
MKGILFILSAPSGAGKTTISRRSVAEIPGLEISVSATTRAARAGERAGVDYHFLAKDDFERRRDAGEFAEWARVHDHFYGTPRVPLEAALASGRDMLLDIDVQGARQMKERYPESVAVFVLPPSVEELERRLRGRGTDPDEVIRRRLERAKEEMKEAPVYDHRIVNREVSASVREFAEIVAAERARVRGS